jgi:hypothetical protein
MDRDDLQHVIERLVSTTGQSIHTHILDPFFTCIAADVPASDYALVAISLVLEQLPDLELHIHGLLVSAQDGLAHRVDLVHGSDELPETLPFWLVTEHGDDVVLEQCHVPREMCLEVLEEVGKVLAPPNCRGARRVVVRAENQHGPDCRVEGVVHVRG